MKKNYKRLLAGVLTAASIIVKAQTLVPFFDQTTYIGAFPVTDNTTATDWTAGWSEFDPENKVYPATTTTVSANITTNTTWTSNNVYQLVGNVSVTNGATLTIQPGTIIRGDVTSKSCLIITKGSKIIAQGTANSPIVFTSNEEPSGNGRSAGDWGGLIILGNAVINTPGTNVSCTGCGTSPNVNQIEGFASYDAVQLYGGNNNADNSGVLSYVRIEFAGVALSGASNSEINGLTLGGVGSQTKIDHIQVSFSGDDAIEWFGGAVNCKYLIAYRTLDDDFDTDFGYSGNVQYGLIVRDPNVADVSKSESFESDNFNPGVGRTPITNAVFSNVTIVGPKRDGTVTPGSNLFLCGAQVRRNSALSIFNSIFTGWPKGLQISGSSTQDNFTTSNADSVAYFKNNWIIGATNAVDVSASGSLLSFYSAFFGSSNNDSTKTNANVSWVNAFPTLLSTKPDFRLNNNSTAKTAADFTNTKLQVQVAPYPVLTGIEQNDVVENTIQLYPNPAENYIYIAGNTTPSTVKIYNVAGGLVATYSGVMNQQIDISTLNTGVYFATVINDTVSKTIKFVVVK